MINVVNKLKMDDVREYWFLGYLGIFEIFLEILLREDCFY